jgi:hypothetical protein
MIEKDIAGILRLYFSESERTKKFIATFLKEVKKMPRAGQHF